MGVKYGVGHIMFAAHATGTKPIGEDDGCVDNVGAGEGDKDCEGVSVG